MFKRVKSPLVRGSVLALAGLTGAAIAQAAPFGDADSVRYAEQLWNGMKAKGLVGPNMIMSKAYTGQHPHGAVLDTIESTMTMGTHTGPVIVKRNYGGDGVSIENVGNDPHKYLGAVTVMYKREAGYDSDNKDWFWVKYMPDGSLAKNPKGMQLAGRVAKGMPAGCIACHTAAPGGDMVYNNDRYAQ